MKKIALLAVAVLAFAASGFAQENYSSWPQYKDVIVTPQSSLGGTVDSFPLLVRLSSANFGGQFGIAASGVNGATVRFADSTGVAGLKYEREAWDSAAQTATFWVRVPSVLSGTASTKLRIYWGKVGAADSSSGAGVFSSTNGFVAVWHLNSLIDATGKGHDLTATGAPADAISPLIGVSKTFTAASTQYYAVNNSDSLLNLNTNNGPYTVSAWASAKANCGGGTRYAVFSKYDNNNTNGTRGYAMQTSSNAGSWRWSNDPTAFNGVSTTAGNWEYAADGTGCVVGTDAAPKWNYIVGRNFSAAVPDQTVPTGASRTTISVNGGTPAVAALGSVQPNSIGLGAAVYIGRLDGASQQRYMNGNIDEVTVSNALRDTNWIKLSFQTQCISGVTSCPATSPVAFGSTVLTGPPVGMSYTPNPATLKKGFTYSLAPSFTSGGATSYSIAPDVNANTGLSFSNTTGVISGIPTSLSGGTPYTVIGTNANGSDTLTLTLSVVNPAAPGLTWSGSPYSLTATRSAGTITPVNSSDSVITCSAAPTLVTGLSLSNKCVITGTPALGTASVDYTVTAGNAGGTTQSHVFIAVADTNATVTSQPANKSATVGASGIKFGVAANFGGDASASYKWVRTYRGGGAVDTIKATLASSSTTDTLTLPTDSVTVAADSSTYKCVITNSLGSVVSNAALLRIVPGISYSPSSFTLGRNVVIATITPTATGGSITSCASSPTLPTGLSLGATTCAITGTPTATASLSTTYNITPTGPGGAGTAFPISIAVVAAPTGLVYSLDTASYEQNVPAAANVPTLKGTTASLTVNTPATYAVTSGALPTGLSLDTATGILTGTPTGTGSTSFKITATNPAGSVSDSLAYNVYAAESYTGSSANFTLNTTVTAANVTTAQPNFPVLIRLTNAHRAIFQNTDSSGIRFTNGSGTHLPYQIESWSTSPTDTSATVWVLADNVAANAATTVRMYWGQSLGGGHSDGKLVFTRGNGYQAVWHMNAGGTGNELDATANNFTATAGNAPTDTAGALGHARKFNGTNQYFVASNTVSALNFQMTDNYSFSAWIYPTAVATAASVGNSIINKGDNQYTMSLYDNAASPKYYEVTTKGNNTYMQARSGPTAAPGPVIIAANTTGAWHHITGTYKGNPVGGAIAESLYFDGALVNTLSSTNSNASARTETFNVFIGGLGTTAPSTIGSGTAGRFWTGMIDELEISGATRSPTWVRLNYKTQKPGVTPVSNLAYTAPAPTYAQGAPIPSNTPALLGTATRFAVSPALPAGLALDSSTGVISGTPSATASAANYTVTALSDSAWSTTATVNITVSPLAPTGLSYTADTLVLSTGVAMNPDSAAVTGGVADSFTVVPPLPAGLSLNKTSGAITGAPSVASSSTSYVVTAINAGGSAKDTLTITVNLTASVPGAPTSVTASGGAASATVSWLAPVSNGGAVITSYRVTAVEDTTKHCVTPDGSTLTCTVTTLTNGNSYTFTVKATNSVGAGAASAATTPAVVPLALPTVSFSPSTVIDTVGKSVTHTPVTTGTLSSCVSTPTLPAGLTLGTTCGITGSATGAVGQQVYKIKATNSTGSDSTNLTLTVVIPRPTISFTPSTVVDTTTVAVSHTPTTTGTITGCTSTPTLPTGLSVSPTTCAITGSTSVVTSLTVYKIKATNGTGSDSANLTLTVVQKPTGILPGSFVIRVTNADKPFVFALPDASTAATEKVSMAITDMWGRTIWEKTVNPSQDRSGEISWNGRTSTGMKASAGMYVVHVAVRNGGKTVNLVQKAVTLKPR